ncbi:L domain-like protein [Dacryopinax primogenitus]|uniref:U2 small nuclear ribonucleoprotein A' n=1 Tax=Dacryopinax primogenitus (strain DJM 731) TaxID=1858805 RepID=M5GAQ3_DACPD|nr:L domain-like protein [Dacryopinax primogenitus]EJU01008.1 L domain-like protein [Dacryopinax primogenitus]
MVKLTPELVAASRSYINPLKDRELDLRGHKIPAIENLGVTKDQHDTIDFTDNSISSLSNLPLLRRLHTLLLSNNRITHISPSLHISCPNLKCLVLTNNALAELGDLKSLEGCRKLEWLALIGCPVRQKKWYREWCLWVVKPLRVLDYQKIKQKERESAKSLFLTPDDLPTALATTLASNLTAPSAMNAHPDMDQSLSAPAGLTAGKAGRMMTADERERVRAAIARATSAEEIKRLEKMLREGYVPEVK